MNNDITEFMTWFLNQVINIITSGLNILDNITFAGTSVLKVILVILFFSAVIPVILTIASSGVSTADKLYRNIETRPEKKGVRKNEE